MARIILADDSVPILMELARSLREAGHMVTSTNNGADAVCLLAHDPPDLLILDMLMPGLDGYEVLQTMGPTAPPVIAISGGEIGEVGFDTNKVARVLLKPFDQNTLLKAVDEVLGGQYAD